MATTKKTKVMKDKLVGMFFHSFGPERVLKHQGLIETSLGEHHYLVQYYDWLVGAAASQGIVHISDMKGWSVYEDEGYWKIEGERLQRVATQRDAEQDQDSFEVLPSVPEL